MSKLEEQFAKNKDLKREDLEQLVTWLKHQPHLPAISDFDALLFLHSCYQSNEATKQCVDNYYTAKTLCPEFFANRNPNSAELRLSFKTIFNFPVDRQTEEGYCVFYSGFRDHDPTPFNLCASMKAFDMMTSLHLHQYGVFNGHIIVVDLKGCTLTHLMKLGIMPIKKFLYFLQEALPVRLKGFHFVNAVPFMDKIMALMKPFMKKELLEVFQIHQGTNETIFKSIPRHCLPNDIGGSCGKIFDLHDRFIQNMLENCDFFEQEEKQLVDESKREGKPRNAGDIFGVEGTFKKLDID